MINQRRGFTFAEMSQDYSIIQHEVLGFRYSTRMSTIIIVIILFLIFFTLSALSENALFGIVLTLCIFGVAFLLVLSVPHFVKYSIEDTVIRLDNDQVIQLYRGSVAVSMKFSEIQKLETLNNGFLILRKGGRAYTWRSYYLNFFDRDQIFVPEIIENYLSLYNAISQRLPK